ncbi:DNA gyrase subunit A [Opitutus terrae]|uniref:DNA gyrase subunit A n=1 Tax=Opitutus terrae (strain DSM 11246 / JCM 15787 / PB90-1) TaxID=452637 RepID=B1ZTK3_OPITP|nr:DNA gyrase subunit A [Opitutus terrae]ACB73948.1 DNA gyrase, A subunit [Opitutus terrae PB90-1]
MYTASEKLSSANITDIMQTAYIDYSMSVIISRALPDARDGLKPVQRRVLYAMLREGLLHNRAFDKCAGVVGEVLKNYHPHGDSSVYDTLVRMAQPWVMRYPLIDPQGNFGSVDGDPAAAYRYTECRLNAIAEDLLRDIEEDTVDFAPNYKESTTEPTVLPAALPNLLMNGSTGIAVGMTTNIPPHNLAEIIDATCAIIDNPRISVDELCTIVQGPDFPTGGVIAGREGILSYLKTGKGIVRTRGKAHTEEMKGGMEQIVVTEIPYNVNRATLVTRIAELVGDKQIDGIRDLRDESDENTRIVIELKRGEQSKVVINQLFQKTALESSFGVTLLALDKKRPKQMNIKELIECYIEHRREVVTRRTRFRLKQAEDRAHILEGYIIALDNLDDFVKIIRASQNREEAKVRLMAKYPLSERQTDAILELRLYQLTGLERGKIEAEYLELMKLIEELRGILESEPKLLALIKKELAEMKEKYTSPRRTEIIAAAGEFRMEDVIPNEGCVITVSHLGFIKRTPVAEYRSQRRGGKGVIGAETYEEDFVANLFTASTHDYILFFTSIGQCHAKKVYDIPEGTRASKGKSVSSFLRLAEGEKIAAMLCVKDFAEDRYLVTATKRGIIKKSALSDYANATREGGLIGINLQEADSVIGTVLTTGENELILVSHQGLAVRFRERDPESGEELFRATGRATGGVTGMRFKLKSDYLDVIEVVDHEAKFLVASEAGLGVRTRFEDYRLINRGGSGVWAIDLPEDGSIKLAGALSVREDDEVMLLTAKGQSIRCPVKDIRETNRGAKGVRLVTLEPGDKLLSIARIVETEEESGAEATPPVSS